MKFEDVKNRLIPLSGRLVVRDIKKEKIGSLFIPEMHQEKGQETVVSEILALGDKCDEELAVGDKVILTPYSGAEIKFEGEDIYRMIRDEDVLAIL